MTRSIPSTIVPDSSPHSFGEASHHDTPSTNLTAYSPGDEVSNVIKGRFKVSVSSSRLTGTDGSDEGTFCDRDPFTADFSSGPRSALSPTATTFTPGQIQPLMNGNGKGKVLNAKDHLSVTTGRQGRVEATHGGVSSLQANSVPDLAPPQVTHDAQARTPSHGAVGGPSPPNSLAKILDQLTLGSGRFLKDEDHFRFSSLFEGTLTSEDTAQRAIKIIGDLGNASVGHLQARFNVHIYPSCCGILARDQANASVLFVQFSDVRDAVQAYEDARKGYWQVTFLKPRDLGSEVSRNGPPSGSPNSYNNHEGQLKAQILFNPQNMTLTARFVNALIRATLARFGDIKAIHSIPSTTAHVKKYCLEFFDTRAAADACKALNNKDIGHEVSMRLEPKRDDTVQPRVETLPHRYVEQPSVTGRSTVPMNDPIYSSTSGYYGMTPDRQALQSNGHASTPNHNQVDIMRIRLGADVRTTIMLRNIPNKIDQGMLKSILDETSLGQYDFMYLRIDFANNCNVGYAFINFEDPISIIDFALARAGRRWNRFSSDKVAEISYATIQGKDCLVQKFRNSSVMLEHPTFRPKIYTTGSGPDAGQEESFPGPDNPSKMRRSVENAEHVGLFAPRHGQQYRDDQRRRRSQFDRGTTAAENEARFEGLFDPARVSHPILDPRSLGTATYGRAMRLPYI